MREKLLNKLRNKLSLLKLKLRNVFTSRSKSDLADLEKRYVELYGDVEELHKDMEKILKKANPLRSRERY